MIRSKCKTKKLTKEKLRKKADALIQEYTKTKYPHCLVCSEPTNCGHHFVPKANSNALRYYLPNIIPICLQCHALVHSQPHLIQPKICFIMGKEWHEDLMQVKQQGVKANWWWYKSNVEELKKLKEAPNATMSDL